MKRVLIFSFLSLFVFFSVSRTEAQSWGNNNDYIVPISHSLANGIMSQYPPTTSIVENNILYYTDLYGFHIYNVSNPQSPVEISSLPIPGRARHFTIKGNYAYILNELGVAFVNIENIYLPEIEDIAWIGFNPVRVIVDEEYLFLAADNGVYAYSVSDTHQLSLLSYTYVAPAATTFAGFIKHDKYIYYANQVRLHVFDFEDPQNVIETSVSNFTGGGSCWGGLAIKDDYLYVVTTLKLHIFNISNPSIPQIVYTGLPTSHTIYSIVVENNNLVLNHSNNGKFTILDISNPTNPNVVYAYPGGWFHHLIYLGALKDNILYVLDNEQEVYNGFSLHLIDINNVSSPTQITEIKSTPGRTRSVALLNKNNKSLALVAQDNESRSGQSGLLRILNVSHPDEPYIESTMEIGTNMISVAVVNENWAVITSGSYSFPIYDIILSLVNIEDVSNPFVTDALTIGNHQTVYTNNNICVSNGVIYVVTKNDLLLFKANDGTLTNIGSTTLYGKHGCGIYTNNSDYVYVAGGQYGFQMYNVTNPAAPFLINFNFVSGACWDVYVEDGVAYVAAYDGGFATFDVSQNMVQPLGLLTNTLGNAKAVKVYNKIAYVGLENGSIQLFDVEDPSQPMSLGLYLTPGTMVNDITLDSIGGINYLYVANELDLLIMEIKNQVGIPEEPALIHNVNVFPNPTTDKATIEINLPTPQNVEINLYNIIGNKVGCILNNKIASGRFQFEVDTKELPSGIYIVEVLSGVSRCVEKLIIKNK